MGEESSTLLGIHEQLQKLNHAMFDENGKVENVKARVIVVESKVEWQGKEIVDIKEDLKTILDNTTWVKRAILTAIIGTLTAGILGAAISIVWSVVKN